MPKLRRCLPFLAATCLLASLACGLPGCQAPAPSGPPAWVQPSGASGAALETGAAGDTPDSNPNGTSASGFDQAAAYLGNSAIRWRDLLTPLVEANGGPVLNELVLDRMIDRRLAEAAITVNQADIDRERRIILENLNDDPNQAQRLLDSLRGRQGLGETRFRRQLRQSAALRKLVQPQVQVSNVTLRQAYDIRYGPRYEARMITVETLGEAERLTQRVTAGEPFMTLAIAHSTDVSSAQGGLLSPISPLDPEYPVAVRDTLGRLQPGQVSAPVAIEQGFAIFRLEKKIPGKEVPFDQVRSELEAVVRLRVEQAAMQRLTRVLIEEAQQNLVIFDPTLKRSFERMRSGR